MSLKLFERDWWTAARRTHAIPFALALLPFLIFFKQTLGITAFYIYDLQYYFFPYRKIAADILLSGSLPLWNPYTCGGMPLLGDGQVAILYPPNWLFLLCRPEHALSLAVLSTFSIAGVGMFRFLKSLELDDVPALFGSLVFMFSGFFVAHVVHVSIPATAAWVPWVFWGIERFIRKPTANRFVVAAIFPAIQALAGHPQIPIYTALAVGLYVLTICVHDTVRERRAGALSPLFKVIAAYTVGYLLAAIQLAPWIELSRFSSRAARTTFELFSMDSLTGFDWLMFLFPYGFGSMRTSWMSPINLPDFGFAIYSWERLPYLGVLTLIFAAGAIMHLYRGTIDSDRSRMIALVIVLLVMLLIAAGSGTPFSRLMYQMPAIGRLRSQARAMGVGVFAIAALAALGMSFTALVVKSLRRPDWRIVVACSIVAIVMFFTLGFAAYANHTGRKDAWQFSLGFLLRISNVNAWIPVVVAVVSVIVAAWYAFTAHRYSAWVLVGVATLDVLLVATTYNATTRSSRFRGTPTAVEFLRKDTDLYRVAVFAPVHDLEPEKARAQLAVSWAMPFRLEDINGFNSLQPRRMVDVLTDVSAEDITYAYLDAGFLYKPKVNLLTQLGVRYAVLQKPFPSTLQPAWPRVYQDEHVAILRNPDDTSRAFFASLVLQNSEASRVLQTMREPDFDPTRFVVVESAMSDDETNRLSNASPATVASERFSVNEIRFNVRTTSQRILVVREAYFPGWQAEIRAGTGAWQALQVLRVNYVHRAVVVPPGSHEIRMVYRSLSVKVGTAVTIATAISCVGLILRSRWRSKPVK